MERGLWHTSCIKGISSSRQQLIVMGFWDFQQTADHRWQWRYISENTGSPVYGGHFCSRNDCIADAMRHGYLSDEMPFNDAVKTEEARSGRKDLHTEGRVTPFLHRLLRF
ncbi:MAG: hypothetical protein ACM3RQ_01175 [Methanocella sp.]